MKTKFILRFANFSKLYGHLPVLKIDDFVIPPGIYWVKGINGSGKSTLLKSIAGILHFDGDIILDRHTSLKKNKIAYRKRVNFAEAEPLYPDFLTGKEMIDLFKDAKDAPTTQEEYFIESMKMQDFIHHPIRTYSSGMLKKLSVVLAFLGNPEIILLDEPAITLDTESLQVLYTWIAERHQQQHVNFLLSSHQPLEIEGLLSTNHLLVEKQTLNFEG